MRGPEDAIQVAIVDYLRAVLPHGWIVKATANKPRSVAMGALEKRMGTVAGWPDLEVVGRGGAMDRPMVCYFEVKAPKGHLSPVQREIHDKLMDAGFPVAVVRSIDDVRRHARLWGLPIRDARAA